MIKTLKDWVKRIGVLYHIEISQMPSIPTVDILKSLATSLDYMCPKS